MNGLEIVIPICFSGFHVAITLLALYRARSALLIAGREGRADRRTLVRLGALRMVAVVVILCGGLLAICTPLMVLSPWFAAWLPTSQRGMAIMLGGSWIVWVFATILLDNLALRWWKARSG